MEMWRENVDSRRICGPPHAELGGRCSRQREDKDRLCESRKAAVVLPLGSGRCVVGVSGWRRGR